MSKKNAQTTWIFGTHAVTEVWRNPDRVIHELIVTEKGLKNFEGVLGEDCTKKFRRPKPDIVERRVLDKRLKGAVHQGIAVISEDLPEKFVQDFVVQSAQKNKSVLVMLDQVTDPHNVGAILRSAAAFGADGVIMQRKHSPALDGVLAKTASGAVEHVPVAYEINLGRALEALKDGGFIVTGLDERGEEFGALAVPDKTVLVLGAEGKGLRPSIKEQCDHLLRLPTSGSIASLNVSNAAAVALYALSF